ncbi:MAG: helix-turn-helix transcriptional regulator [Planctomycetes bacterium]|nr:helix-turn-helix transcriptional regulator [Planctomycetota bacterium]
MSNNRNIQLNSVSIILKALSNPNRLRIFQRLCTCCPPGTKCQTEGKILPCVGEVGKDLSIAPSTLSHHLKELKNAGLIEMERQGQNIQCRVDPEVLEELSVFFTKLESGASQ